MPFDEKYFITDAYKNVSFAKYSYYWWSTRFYAILGRRYGQCGTRLLEINSVLGQLVGHLDDMLVTPVLDVNHWALAQSKAVAPPTLLQVASTEDTPFADGTFRVVVNKHVLEHLLPPWKAIAELGCAMAPGGVFIFATPNFASLSRPSKGQKWIGYQDPTHISLKPPSKWLAMIKGAGFKLKQVYVDGFWDTPYLLVIPKYFRNCFLVPWAVFMHSAEWCSCQCVGLRVSCWSQESCSRRE